VKYRVSAKMQPRFTDQQFYLEALQYYYVTIGALLPPYQRVVALRSL